MHWHYECLVDLSPNSVQLDVCFFFLKTLKNFGSDLKAPRKWNKEEDNIFHWSNRNRSMLVKFSLTHTTQLTGELPDKSRLLSRRISNSKGLQSNEIKIKYFS